MMVTGVDMVHTNPVDKDVASGHRFKPGHHPKNRRFAAARRADQHEELTLVNQEVKVRHREKTVRVDLVDPLQLHRGHCSSAIPQPRRTLRKHCRVTAILYPPTSVGKSNPIMAGISMPPPQTRSSHQLVTGSSGTS